MNAFIDAATCFKCHAINSSVTDAASQPDLDRGGGLSRDQQENSPHLHLLSVLRRMLDGLGMSLVGSCRLSDGPPPQLMIPSTRTGDEDANAACESRNRSFYALSGVFATVRFESDRYRNCLRTLLPSPIIVADGRLPATTVHLLPRNGIIRDSPLLE